MFYNPFLHHRMIKYYSDNSNYHHYRATIYEEDSVGIIRIKDTISLENSQDFQLDIRNDTMRVYSPDIEHTWELFNPYVGMEFEFIGAFFIFYNGGTNAIVQISVDGNEILDFDSGKEALLTWASTYY